VDLIERALDAAPGWLPLLGTLAVVAALVGGIGRVLKLRWKDQPDTRFRFQLTMLLLAFAGLVAIIVSLPIDGATVANGEPTRLRGDLLKFVTTVAVVLVVLMGLNRVLRRRWKDQPDTQFRFQLIMLLLTFVGLIAVILTLPIDKEGDATLRLQLLSLIGILLSAAIALSSTTFIGNIMAGIMLKTIRSARPGDFVTIGELTGRITEMDLLHTEVQTEFRDLVTVPNLNMVTQPIKVVRASGTIITAELSLGYDVPHARVGELLNAAAANAGLKDSFVHVRELGDFAVTYRVAGLLEDVHSLISARSRLRVAALEALHGAGIEIVSPNFMNTRALAPDARVVPQVLRSPAAADGGEAEAIAFDKADEAASVEEIKKEIEALDKELAEAADGESAADPDMLARLEKRKARLVERFADAEKQRKDKDE